MPQKQLTISSLAEEQYINIDYSDDDIIIIDNIKSLAEPSVTRLEMNFIAICMRGKVQALMNGRPVTLAERQLLLCPPGVTFSDFMFSPEFEFKAVFMTSRILQSFLREKMAVWNEVTYIHRMHVVTMDERDIAFFSHFYDMLRLCIDNRVDNPYRIDVIQSLIRGALLGLCGTLRQMLLQQPAADAPGAQAPRQHQPVPSSLFQRFLDLLNNNPGVPHSVDAFADQLCVSPKYLSVVCKRSSGKTAGEWIREHVLEDIRYYLRQTDLPMKQVADRLGFANPSFFGKYVKQHFGMTPTQVRAGGTGGAQ